MQLLVSPSNIDEAKRSVAADIIDVKKPSEGSLGANFPWVIKEIKSLLAKPVSAAIGDFAYKPGGLHSLPTALPAQVLTISRSDLPFDGAAQARDVIAPWSRL